MQLNEAVADDQHYQPATGRRRLGLLVGSLVAPVVTFGKLKKKTSRAKPPHTATAGTPETDAHSPPTTPTHHSEQRNAGN